MAPTIDQQFIEYIVKSLVSYPDDVHVERILDERGVLLELSVHPEDLGRVIGKRGVTAQALRTLLRALGVKNDARYNLKIVNTDGNEGDNTPLGDGATGVDVENSDDRRESTRKELAELDDLDI
jgi:predicted RNA-binding protein YlqC (UPF0109 family)